MAGHQAAGRHRYADFDGHQLRTRHGLRSDEAGECFIRDKTLALWFILGGLLGIWASATNGIRHWSNLTFMLKVGDAVFVTAGLTLLAAGAWLILFDAIQRTVALVGAAAAGIFVVAPAAGIWHGVIPCSSPG